MLRFLNWPRQKNGFRSSFFATFIPSQTIQFLQDTLAAKYIQLTDLYNVHKFFFLDILFKTTSGNESPVNRRKLFENLWIAYDGICMRLVELRSREFWIPCVLSNFFMHTQFLFQRMQKDEEAREIAVQANPSFFSTELCLESIRVHS